MVYLKTQQHSATHCITLQYTATRCNTHYNTLDFKTMPEQQCVLYHALLHTASHCSTLQHTTTHCNTLQHDATHCNTLQHTAIHYNTLQHTTTHLNTLQHKATHCNTPQYTATHCARVMYVMNIWSCMYMEKEQMENRINKCTHTNKHTYVRVYPYKCLCIYMHICRVTEDMEKLCTDGSVLLQRHEQ